MHYFTSVFTPACGLRFARCEMSGIRLLINVGQFHPHHHSLSRSNYYLGFAVSELNSGMQPKCDSTIITWIAISIRLYYDATGSHWVSLGGRTTYSPSRSNNYYGLVVGELDSGMQPECDSTINIWIAICIRLYYDATGSHWDSLGGRATHSTKEFDDIHDFSMGEHYSD